MNPASLSGMKTSSGVAGRTSIEAIARHIVLRQWRHLRSGWLNISDASGLVRVGREGELSAGIQVHSDDFYRRILFGGGLGAADSYVNGGWSTDELTTTLRLFARDQTLAEAMDRGWARVRTFLARLVHRLHANTPHGSLANIHAHYDLGNELFRLFLDPTMNYSAGVFERPGQTMEQASVAKMDRICRKLRLTANDHLLEIGTGWGGLALHAARKFGCRVTTATISAQQHALATRRVADAGLGGRVAVLLKDYRELKGEYDKLVSVEMIEAVGHAYLETYFRQCCQLLKPDGLMLLQAIVTPEYRYETSRRSVDFIRRYIFPGSCLASVGRISRALGRATDFSTLHMEDIGPHYAETLRRWAQRFEDNRPRVRSLGYDERFIRLWKYYLSYCEAGFEERIVGDVQLLLGRPAHRHPSLLGRMEGVSGGYVD